MKIALITDGIAPYVIGGMQKHSFYLAKYFAKQKIQVDLIHYNQSHYNIHELEFFTAEEKQYIQSIVLEFPQSLKFPGHYLYNSYRYSCLAYNAIKDNIASYDFIYTKGFSGWKLISEKQKAHIICCPIGINFHGYEMYQMAIGTKHKLQQVLLKPFVKKLTQQADVVFSYGGKITPIIESIGVSKSKIIEIPSGVEVDFINENIASHKEPYTKFVFLGRAERRKGIIELNEVIRQLIEEKKTVHFEFIGPIPEELKINHSSIIYVGEIRDSQKIKSILQQADVLVCPSWSEGFPNVILEAMASGLAIIATNVGAVSALVNNNTGWLIEPLNTKQLYNAMNEALTSGLIKNKKEESLRLIKTQFNWDIIAVKTIDAIRNAISADDTKQ